MGAADSSVDLLCLHAVRLLGGADAPKISSRFGLDPAQSREALLDFEARGWVSRWEFAGERSWSLTDAGRKENERQLAAELDACLGRDAVARAHADFVPLNDVFGQAATNWQIRPLPGDEMAFNDHTDFRWDDRVLERLLSAGRRLRPICEQVTAVLSRFDGYADRYDAALDRVRTGQARWVDSIEVDSCHTVWIQLHEDLLATLGLTRDAGH